MCLDNIIMNIKNIFITSGMTLIFGVYSIYNIWEYLNNMDRLYNNKIMALQQKLEETNRKIEMLLIGYEKITNEIIKITDDFNITTNKIVIIENKLLERSLYCFSPNYDYYESSDDEIKSVNNNSETNNNLETNNNSETNKISDCVEIVNFEDVNTLHVTNCISKNNSFLNKENEILPVRSRSTSITDLNWGGLMKTFLLG